MTSPATSRVSTRQGVASSHLEIAARRPGRTLLASVLRTRSRHAREVLAHGAWPGRAPAELDAWALQHEHDHALPPGADARWLADYARVLAVQFDDPQERRIARSLLESLARHGDWDRLRTEFPEVLMGLRVLGGDASGAVEMSRDTRVRPDVAAAAVADANNPALNAAGDLRLWAKAFNDALHGPALAPILPPADGAAPHFDTLTVQERPPVDAPLRVTVLMSAYRRGPSLLTAARSVLAQTWPDLELIVVDDASGLAHRPEVEEVLARAEALDPRVRVLRKAVNGGTYRARNSALRLATGDLGIVLDSDDWWHPQTLEVLAAPLLADPGLMATRGQGARITEDLVLTRLGYRPRMPSFPTVLFRLPEVLDRIGFYDTTRKGADNEYVRRMQTAFDGAMEDVDETTTLLRAGQTLSSDEFVNGWQHPARYQYKQYYAGWHEQIAAGTASPYLDPDLPRSIGEPARWSREVHPLLSPPDHLDLCLAGDWRRFGGPQRCMVEELRAAREAGLSVGIMHLEALRFMTHQDLPLTPQLMELLEDGAVRWVLPDEDIDIDLLLVRYPPILQYPPTLTGRVRARQVVVMANQAPCEPDGTDQRYVVADVSERAAELFEAPVRWMPESPRLRQVLLEHEPDLEVTPWDNPPIIDVDEWHVRPGRAPGAEGRPVVIGRHSRDNRIKFAPTWEELLTGYDFGEGHEVRILGGTVTVEDLRTEAQGPPLPTGWTLLPHGSQPVREFLAGLDFYLYLDNAEAFESFGLTMLEAAASGVLTIVHPKHRPTLGDLVDYALPGEAQALVATYVADPAAYRERVERTLDLVRRRYGGAGFVRRARELGAGAGSSRPAPEVRTPAEGEVELRPGHLPPGMPLLTPRDELTGGVSGLQLVTVPLRSAGDGVRADGLTVVHTGDDESLSGWLRTALAAPNAPGWSLSQHVQDAPAGVVAVVLRRDGLAWALGRGRWHEAGDRELADLAGSAPDGWADLAWWDRRPPERIRLSLGPAGR